MTRLYELQEQLVAIDNILAENTNEETQEILESAREDVLKAIDGKIESVLEYINDCKSKAEQIKKDEERLYKKRKTLENKTEYLKNMLLWYMKSNNKTKDSFGNWDITIAKTAGKVVFDLPEEDIPLTYKKVSYSIDKTALKENMVDGAVMVSLDDGSQIRIAHLEEGESLRIK